MSSLAEWLEKITALHPKEIDLGLERVAALARKMRLQTFSCPVVTIGGTNGKGSCVKYLETILTLAGYRCGAYTSPHLLSFNERIRINNANVSDQALLTAFEAVEHERAGCALTFFEYTTLAALWLFQQQPLDIILLEVGLGGRLDAVNIVDSDIAIITSIDLDHTDWLGNSRAEIAVQKAGIGRNNKPVIIGDNAPPEQLLTEIKAKHAIPYLVHRDFSYAVHDHSWSWSSDLMTLPSLPLPNLPLQNAATALMALALLQAVLPCTPHAIQTGLQAAQLLGRFQWLDSDIIVDVAHNEASARLLAQRCQTLDCELLAVVGMLADKDMLNTLRHLERQVVRWYLASLSVPRGACATQLATALENIAKHKCYTYDCVAEALAAAQTDKSQQQKILVFGSFYTVAQVLQQFPQSVTSLSGTL